MTALLTADGGGPTGLAAVDGSGALTMAMQALAPTSGEEVYEAWVIAADGVPVPLGSFQVDASGTGTLASSDLPTEPGIVLALTREPGPGATSPTLPIVASGEAAPTSAG
jgi:anti-sigma-K factor RskA